MFFSEQYYADPHPVLARSRSRAPVERITDPAGRAVWIVTGYAESRAALSDPRLRKRFTPPDEPPLFHVLNSDGADHTRLRKPLTRPFTARRVEALRPGVEALTDGLLAGLAGEVDLVADFALPLPFLVVCDLLGVPEADRADLRAWGAVLSAESHDAAQEAAELAMTDYFRGLVGAKRATPADDLLGALVGSGLDDRELVSTALLVLTAGYETTVNLISTGVLTLLRNPDELAALRADRSRLPGVVEEVLRFDGPLTTATPRYTSEPVRIGDVLIPERQVVLVALAAADRDPARFDRPNTFDPTRTGGHLAFGHGVHFCLGAQLARLEGEVAFTALLDHFPTWELASDDLAWQRSPLFRGLRSLPVRLER
ncbi:cytochrome P450 [Umezawaea sp.]|uniref:cytochrome P450 family protein n=1 Tax=Umezawaea sp. TaxID=1955258 RepID=UPI002ED344E8